MYRCRCQTKKPGRTSGPRKLLLSMVLIGTPPAWAAADLTTLSLEQLLDLTVIGASKYEQKQSEVAAAVSIITRQEIRAFGWRTLADALATLPGIYTTYDRQYTNLGARGFGLPGDFNTRILVTINGNRLNDPNYDQGPLGRSLPIDTDLIERIEYIPGPGGAVYGQNAMFGVVNVVTRTGLEVSGVELAANYQAPGSTREARATWGRKLDNGVDVLLSLSGMRARGDDRFFDFGAAGVSGTAAGLDAERDRELFLRVARGAWSFDYVDGDRKKNDPTGAYLSDPLVPGQYQADHFQVAQLQYSDTFADDTLQVSGRLFAGTERYTSELRYDTLFAFPATGTWRGAEGRLVSTALPDHKLMFGVELHENLRHDQAGLDVADPSNDFFVNGSGYRVGVYGQDEWRIVPSVLLTGGLRVDRNDTTGTKLSPRAAVIWSASSRTNIKLLYGRAHRAPNSFERDYDDAFAQVGNPMLRGEQIDTLESVLEHRLGEDLALRASAYRWVMRDLVTLGIDPVSGLTQYQSGDTVRARGLELSADKTWRSGARLRGSVSFQDVAYAGGASLLNSPRRLARVNLSTPLPVGGLRLAYEWRHDSSRLTLDGSRVGGFALSNLRLSTAAIAKGLEVGLGIQNLFDKRYAHPAADINWQNALDQDGRSIALNLTYSF